MIEQILKSLVLENRRLIIPGIGAFLTKDIENTQKKVTFSSFLKYDDGLLTKLLCERNNISETEAKQYADDLARRISNALDSGNHYPIIGFGYFTKDKNGIIDFITENINPAVDVVIPKIEEPVIPTYVPPVIPTTPIYTPPQENPNNNFNFENFPPPTGNTRTNNPPKKSNVGYWILAIILLIIAILLFLYLFNKDFKASVNSLIGSKQPVEIRKTDTVQTVTQIIDTTGITPQQDTATAEQKPVEPVQPIQTATNTGVINGKYQVILGSYLDRKSAEKFANELRSKGYNTTIPDRLAGEWIIVIAYESNDKADAERMRNQFAAEGYDDAYVRTRPGAIVSSTTSSSSTVSQSQQSSSSDVNTDFGSSSLGGRGKYQVVAGCFFERSNAETRAKELVNKGFNVTLPDRLYGEYYIVIIHESNDKNEANRVKDQCIAAGYADAWIRTRY